jgi:pyruvate ferredoxin oxidoreductase beta subunit
VVDATGGLEEFSAPTAESAWQAAWVHSLFGNAASVASGVAAAVRRIKGRGEMHVLAQIGGDGTTDIGWLSAIFERNDDVLIVGYDSEGHANGCVQRSSAASETVGEETGNLFGAGRSVCRIAIARGIPYVASASVADLRDLERKVAKAMSLHGARTIHVHAPCPLGSGAASRDTIRLARLAVESGIFPLFEAEHGAITGSRKIRHRVPVGEYLKPQKRYAQLLKMDNQPDIVRLQEMADRNIAEFDLLSSEENS